MAVLSSGPRDERIPASAVDDLLRTVRIGLDQLELELQQANLDIVECEARLAAARPLPDHEERVAAARSAIETVALGAHEHLSKAIAAAHAHGAARIAAAEAEGLWLVQTAREELAAGLVGPLRLERALPDPGETPALPPVATHAELTSWATPPALDRAARPEPPEDATAAAVVLAPPLVAAERAFWSEAEGTGPLRGDGGVDLLLTAVSAVLVIAVLAILLLWIG